MRRRSLTKARYLIVDYERNNFTVAQAVYPDTSVPQKIVTIHPPSSSKSGLGKGAIAGIAIGAVVVISLLCAGAWWVWRKKRTPERSIQLHESSSEAFIKPELDNTLSPVDSKNRHDLKVPEMDAFEIANDKSMIKDGNAYRQEMHGSHGYPMEADSNSRHELRGDTGAAELPGKTNAMVYELQ